MSRTDELSKEAIIKKWCSNALKIPEVYDAEKYKRDNIKAIFFEGPAYKGNATRVFAYVGVPSTSYGQKVPGIILVHGGGGTAYSEWVKIWNDKGYAAIAVDLEGHIPVSIPDGPVDGQYWLSHSWSGPSRNGGFDDISECLEDQWTYHAVYSVMSAHTLLASMQNVDSSRIGITGISWGGIITSLTAGVDKRLAFAVPVYGCGYLYESKGIFGTFFEDSRKKMWDPSNFLTEANIPMLWVNSDDDFHFSLDIFSKSYKMVKEKSVLTIHPDMKHSHPHGWAPEEIYAFADSVVKNCEGLMRIMEITHDREQPDTVSIKIDDVNKVKQVQLYYSAAEIRYDLQNRSYEGEWIKIDIPVMFEGSCIKINIPSEARLFYMNFTDYRNLVVSTELMSSP